MPKKVRFLPFMTLSVIVGFLAIASPVLAVNKEKVLYSFCAENSCNDGAGPSAGVIVDSAGNLYGATAGGGTGACKFGCGTIFQLTNRDGKWTEKVLHSFDRKDGEKPWGLIFDSAGNLYGATYEGGAFGYGTVFELIPGKGEWTEKVLHSFNRDGTDGIHPGASVIMDTAGNLYGTTGHGGTHNRGTVFELILNNGGWTEKVLHSFSRQGKDDGMVPYASLVRDSIGNLYGTTSMGGTFGTGTVFEMLPNNGKWTEKVLHSFGSKIGDGSHPSTGLTLGATGNLYGTTPDGGFYTGGTVFELIFDNRKWTEKVLHSLNPFKRGASSPLAQLVFDNAGNLYDTYWGGGVGGIFELTLHDGMWKESVLHRFSQNGRDGFGPFFDGLVFDTAGNLYGTTIFGGLNGGGTVFELTGETLHRLRGRDQ